MYIRILEIMGLAHVKHVAAMPKFHESAKPVCDFDTLQAVITHRYDVLSKYVKSLRTLYVEEIAKLRTVAPQDALKLEALKASLYRNEKTLQAPEREQLQQGLARSRALATVYVMRHELEAIWERSTASKDQLLAQLQDWCHRAEASGVQQLQDFSLRLRSYA